MSETNDDQLTVRDHFVMAAVTGLLGNKDWKGRMCFGSDNGHAGELSEEANAIADALMNTRAYLAEVTQ